MSEHYPRIRIRAENGYLLVREGLSFCFYMRRPHDEVKQAALKSLETYLRVVGPQALSLYADMEGDWQELDDAGWGLTRRQLLDDSLSTILLRDTAASGNQYRFDYQGRPLFDPAVHDGPDAVSAVSFWLPTEYLEEHGPGRVRELALELAAPLPFCSGHAGLSFNGETEPLSMSGEARALCFRHPGLDIPKLEHLSCELGTRVRGASWLTFLGQPVLGELGGVEELRARLASPGSTVQELEGKRAVITLGKWPEAGDTARSQRLPAYRELARVLEPWLYREERILRPASLVEDVHRWERRFLD
jgi:hypothetical protein